MLAATDGVFAVEDDDDYEPTRGLIYLYERGEITESEAQAGHQYRRLYGVYSDTHWNMAEPIRLAWRNTDATWSSRSASRWVFRRLYLAARHSIAFEHPKVRFHIRDVAVNGESFCGDDVELSHLKLGLEKLDNHFWGPK